MTVRRQGGLRSLLRGWMIRWTERRSAGRGFVGECSRLYSIQGLGIVVWMLAGGWWARKCRLWSRDFVSKRL